MLIPINRLRSVSTTGWKSIEGSGSNLRRGVDGLGELLTACVAVHNRVIVEKLGRPKR